MKRILSRPLTFMLCLILVIILASFFAGIVNTSGYQVKVSKITFDVDEVLGIEEGAANDWDRKLSGYLYMPKGVDANNPAPTVLLTHGYLNNAEMQEIGAIELSRRGYVVFAFDQYDHGDSTWNTPAAFNFFSYSVYDAVQCMYEQDYVLKDAAGNAMIGVSGHSMGGFSSELAASRDETDFTTNGYRKVAAMLAVGADFRYTGPVYNNFATRSCGVIAAHWDQFFFDNSANPKGTVIYKDYVTDTVGKLFLGEPDSPTAGTWYDVAGGQRIIYTPNETHPQNTWSLTSGAYTIDFFEEAFTYQLNLYGLGSLADYNISTIGTGQTWWLKEGFTLIALVALIVLIFPAFALLGKVPYLRNALVTSDETGEIAMNQAVESTTQESSVVTDAPQSKVIVAEDKRPKALKMLRWLIIGISTFISVFFLTRFMDRTAEGITLMKSLLDYVISIAAILILGLWLAAIIGKANKGEAGNSLFKAALNTTLYGLFVILVAIGFKYLLDSSILKTTNPWLGAPSVNTIAYWAMCSAGVTLIVVFATKPLLSYGQVSDGNPFGLKTSAKGFLSSLLISLGLVVGLLLIVFLIGVIFKTDFRFYTYAIQIFNGPQLLAAFKYMPYFFVFYFAAGISVFVNTKGMKGWKADLLASFLLAGPVVIFLIYQYSVLYATGVAPYPNFALNAILCVGLVPSLVIAAITSRRMSEKTGNIWAAVIFNTIFLTIITLANTAVYQLSL